jgi:hypothetical protein
VQFGVGDPTGRLGADERRQVEIVSLDPRGDPGEQLIGPPRRQAP